MSIIVSLRLTHINRDIPAKNANRATRNAVLCDARRIPGPERQCRQRTPEMQDKDEEKTPRNH